MHKDHHYEVEVKWTGNAGDGTRTYNGYERSHEIKVNNKPSLSCSSDPAFRGDRSKYNPEELLLASISSCHMLWYLHLCADAGIVVTEYTDHATGTLSLHANGGGRFTAVILHPRAKVKAADMIEKAMALHEKANQMCFIANSLNFEIIHQPEVIVGE